MLKGKYAREYAITCHPADRRLLYKMSRHLSMNHRNIWIRRVEIGDIISSKDGIIRWKIIEDKKTGDLYLAFIEDRNFNEGYRHGETCLYHVELDFREGHSQKYMLYRIRSRNTDELDLKEK